EGNGYCYTNDGLSCGPEGRCIPIPAVGQACAPSTICVEGAFCDGSSTCSPKREAGGTCTGFSEACSVRTFCDYESGQCQPRKADGAACEGDEQCASESC